MTTIRETPVQDEVHYPTGDGKPVGETPIHRDNLLYNVYILRRHFAADPTVYVSGNMFLYYVQGDNRRHVSPDVFMVRGLAHRYRKAYFTWEEGGKGPDFVIEMTSASTRKEDLKKKFILYRDVLRVREYFLFDPEGEYLDPPLQGYRLIDGQYVPIERVEGRLPSDVLGMSLEGPDQNLFVRIYNPATGQWLPLPEEIDAARERAEAERERAEAEREQLAKQLEQSEAERQKLLAELEALRGRTPESGA